MGKRLKFKEMLKTEGGALEDIPEHRTGQNTKCAIKDAGLGKTAIITSEMVLTEVLNYFPKRSPELRQVKAEFVKTLRNNHNVRVVGQTNALFEDVFDLYARRPDKQWSHTDCASMLIMQRAGIAEVLSYDRHFFLVGFIPFLRESA